MPILKEKHFKKPSFTDVTEKENYIFREIKQFLIKRHIYIKTDIYILEYPYSGYIVCNISNDNIPSNQWVYSNILTNIFNPIELIYYDVDLTVNIPNEE